MSTLTPARPIDPEDESIETTLQKLEKKLRWWSPLLLGWFQTFTPFTYTSAVGLSTVVGYILFFTPSIIAASLFTDIALNYALFTTITTAFTGVQTFATIVLEYPFLTSGAFVGLYIIFFLSYEPVEPNGTSVSSPYEWEELLHSLYICTPVFIGSVIAAVFFGYTNAVIATVLASWWVSRRVTFTVIWDETRYLVEPPYTEVLLATRVPLLIGLLSIAYLGYPMVGYLLCGIPFVMGVVYLYWRRIQGDDSSQTLPDVRMYEKTSIPHDIVDDYTAGGAYKADANERLLRESVEKFNSFLDTEIDTERRLNLPQSRLNSGDIRSVKHEANSIYEDFTGVAYRPDRFEDLRSEVTKYSDQLLETIREDEQADF